MEQNTTSTTSQLHTYEYNTENDQYLFQFFVIAVRN